MTHERRANREIVAPRVTEEETDDSKDPLRLWMQRIRTRTCFFTSLRSSLLFSFTFVLSFFFPSFVISFSRIFSAASMRALGRYRGRVPGSTIERRKDARSTRAESGKRTAKKEIGQAFRVVSRTVAWHDRVAGTKDTRRRLRIRSMLRFRDSLYALQGLLLLLPLLVSVWIIPRLSLAGAEYYIKHRARDVHTCRYHEH